MIFSFLQKYLWWYWVTVSHLVSVAVNHPCCPSILQHMQTLDLLSFGVIEVRCPGTLEQLNPKNLCAAWLHHTIMVRGPHRRLGLEEIVHVDGILRYRDPAHGCLHSQGSPPSGLICTFKIRPRAQTQCTPQVQAVPHRLTLLRPPPSHIRDVLRHLCTSQPDRACGGNGLRLCHILRWPRSCCRRSHCRSRRNGDLGLACAAA